MTPTFSLLFLTTLVDFYFQSPFVAFRRHSISIQSAFSRHCTIVVDLRRISFIFVDVESSFNLLGRTTQPPSVATAQLARCSKARGAQSRCSKALGAQSLRAFACAPWRRHASRSCVWARARASVARAPATRRPGERTAWLRAKAGTSTGSPLATVASSAWTPRQSAGRTRLGTRQRRASPAARTRGAAWWRW